MRQLTIITEFALLIILLGSCSGARYNMLNELDEQEGHVTLTGAEIPTLKEGQELCITVTALNEESAQYFRTSREREGATGIECLYYQIDEDGTVELPLIGEVIIKGLTLEAAESRIKTQLQTLLKDPTVRIEYTDYHVSVLGDVDQPGVFGFSNGRVTILEAISKAGGISQFGRRDNVMVIRETGKDVKHIRIDLTKGELWASEYYYLHSNDVVLISSNSGRITNSKNITAWGSILVGIGTVAAIIVSR